ncbi:pirin-like isoform X2 [Mytilus trossulus]|uniref:pirin-like isoform X2 n=1 Tax=Mytilus trossulus TaxID=6551 RepID=UPI003004C387
MVHQRIHNWTSVFLIVTNLVQLIEGSFFINRHSSKLIFDKPRTDICLLGTADNNMPSRNVKQAIQSKEQDEGVGAKVRRSVGSNQLRNFDPFLLLDDFRVKAPAGFPDHPHRGFETVTYVLEGGVTHEDFCGHKDTIHPGDLQWMTAGRGIVHCEMPHGTEQAHGLQLWVNLASKDKMTAPAYQELLDKDIPKTKQDGVHVKVIAGESLGIKSPVYTRTPTMYLDFQLDQGAVLNQPIPQGWNSFIYTLSGKASFGEDSAAKQHHAHYTLVLDKNGDGIRVENKSPEVCRFVLIGGKPLGEPVKQHGPFVMCTDEEIKQALNDYRQGENGFEKAHTWNSWVAYE